MTTSGSNTGLDRRGFLAAGAGLVAGAAIGGPATAQQRTGAGRAKNLIFLSADGLSVGAMSLADLYTRRKLGRPLHWFDLIASGEASRAMLATEPADWMVTDSAASASAWSIGERVNNDAVNVTPDGREPTPLFVRAKQAGCATGVITTTGFVSASPAAMVANASRRGDIERIRRHFLERGIDLVIGGGGAAVTDEALAEHGVTPVRDAWSLAEACETVDGRLFALLEDGDLPFEIERPETYPSQAEQTRLALERMARIGGEGGFALFIENEHTDTATHMNDAATMLRDTVAFDEALAVALAFARERGDTLVVVATDHANSNPGFARYAADADEQFERLCAARGSFRTAIGRLRAMADRRDGAVLAGLLRELQGVELTSEEVAILDDWLQGERVSAYEERSDYYCPLGSVVGNHFGVAFATYRHTLDYVEATAFGPGAEALIGARHQVDVHGVLTRALGLA
jgi:alkaline phosphatase